MTMHRSRPENTTGGAAALPTTRAVPGDSSNASTCASAVSPTRAEALDAQWRGWLATGTGGVSIASLGLAALDWAMHLSVSPAKVVHAWAAWHRGTVADLYGQTPLGNGLPVTGDQRFSSPLWTHWPYHVWRDAFLRLEHAWQDVTTAVDGVSPHHARLTSFVCRQWLDLASPSNCWWLNPTVLDEAARSRGANFMRGAEYWLEDLRDVTGQWSGESAARRPLAFEVGKDVAITPGHVVFRNALFELIQYAPATSDVLTEPILFVPSWIMKYYILDLTDNDSMVRYLVESGLTVFMISWRNPGADARDDGLARYLDEGVLQALDVVRQRCGDVGVHAVGYCLGGTVLTIAAAALARRRAGSLRTVTLLATETDFAEPGELGMFIDDSALSTLDALMRMQGYLDGLQLSQAFQMLNARDLVWSRMLGEYLLGRRQRPNDLISWNRDTTRIPHRLHADVLQHLFLRNDLAEGRYCVDGRPVALSDIDVPIFAVGTEHDHVSPWRSVYKIHMLMRQSVTFLLTSGGHNAGIVSEPGHKGRRYRVRTREPGTAYIDPDRFLADTDVVPGSWWDCWRHWLNDHSSARCAPRDDAQGALGPAPGEYVKDR